ncbi:MAG TPA: hypothetical protein VI452_10565 [Marmoricola sp.]
MTTLTTHAALRGRDHTGATTIKAGLAVGAVGLGVGVVGLGLTAWGMTRVTRVHLQPFRRPAR